MQQQQNRCTTNRIFYLKQMGVHCVQVHLVVCKNVGYAFA